MGTHSLLDAAVLACITLGIIAFLLGLANYLEYKALRKSRKENSPTNFDLDK